METKRILIVDDDEAIRTVLAELFREEGYTVKTAANGRQALAAVRNVNYDVLLTDLDMPEVDGPALARALQVLKIEIPVVVMAASRRGAARSREMAAVAFLQKPFNIATVIATVDSVVNADNDTR